MKPRQADEARDRRSWCLPLRRSCRGCAVRGSVFGTAIRHAPNGPARVIGDQQRSVLHDCQGSRTSPHLGPMLTRDPETRHKIFVTPVRPAVLEPYPHNFVAGRLRTVPGALKRHERIAAILGGKLLAV